MKGFGRVGVLAGGPSSERSISLRSGKAVYSALKSIGIPSVFIDVRDTEIKEDLKRHKIDVAFIALHGGLGEDGTIQNILEELGIPYTGSGPEASRLALDKLASRLIFQNAELDVPEYRVLKRGELLESGDMKLPLVVKPRSQGSSIGLTVVFESGEVDKAVEEAFSYGENILVEEFIKGRELTVGILDDEPLPVVEIMAEKGCYDYHAKYESPDTEYLVPAPVRGPYFRKAREAALRAHKLLGCRSFSRVDMILSGNNRRLYILEVNTIPGLTSRSLLPKAAAAAGISFSGVCKKILEGVFK